jgi:hypothetical protein
MPTRRVRLVCCARTTIGQAATLPSAAMNSRRRISDPNGRAVPAPSRRRISDPAAGSTAYRGRGRMSGLDQSFFCSAGGGLWPVAAPVPRGRVSAAGESGHSIRSPTAGHPPKLAVADARPHSRRTFVQRGSASEGCRRLALRPPGRALVGRSWRGLGRRRAIMAGVALEIACSPVCRSRRWCRASVLSRRPCPHPAEGDIRTSGFV